MQTSPMPGLRKVVKPDGGSGGAGILVERIVARSQRTRGSGQCQRRLRPLRLAR